MSFTVGGSTPQLTFADATVQNTAALPLTGGSVSADITVNGITVGRGAGAVSSNTVVGSGALTSNSTGQYITAVGRLSAPSTTAGANDAFGYASLYSNASGTNNVALGFSAGYYVQGNFNTAVGSGTLSANYTLASGSYNTAVGGNALYNNTTASNNTAVGYQAGYSNTTSASNTFVGRGAGYSSTGVGNVLIGDITGYSLTTGTYNTFIGAPGSTGSCGYYVTTGSKNTIIGGYNGNQGGLDIRTASNNTVLSDGDGYIRYAAYGVSITTASTRLAATCGVGTMVWFSGYNTSNGAQGWWLVAATNSTGVTTISSNNGTGLTVTFTQSSGSIFASTSSGTIAGLSYMFVD